MPSSPHPVAVTGATGALGRRVSARLASSPSVTGVTAVDVDAADLKPGMEGAAALVHLAFTTATGRERDDGTTARANVEATRRVLDAAGAVGVAHVVVVSSAAVYGAWPGNPVPLTEDAPVRPNPELGYAVQKAEIERLCGEWADDHPSATLAVLRPAPDLAAGEDSWLARALQAASAIRAGDDDPPAQFLALDDLADAVVLACERRLDGAYNVAPDGWLTGEEVRALAGSPPRLRVPLRWAARAATFGWRWGLAPNPPGLLRYTMHPWVVANDRIKAAGWSPTSSNEEVYVAARPGTPWSRLSPKRRQELALGVSGGVVAGAVAGVLVAIRKLRSRRTG